jgi:hypothetical protein
MRVRLASAVALVIAMTLWGAVCGGASAAAPALPAISIDRPIDHERCSNPVLVIFSTTADLGTMLAGSNSGDANGTQPPIYLHIAWDSTVVMPTADQLSQVDPNEYQFEVPKLPPGMHQFRVFWGDSKTHRPVGPAQSVLCNITQA